MGAMPSICVVMKPFRAICWGNRANLLANAQMSKFSVFLFVFRLDIISLVFFNQNIKLLMCQEKKSEATEPHNCMFRRHKLKKWEDCLGNVIVTSTHGKKHTICTFLPGVCVTVCPFYMEVSRCQETLWFYHEHALECFKLWLIL